MDSITSLPRYTCARPGIAKLSLALAAGVLLSHCTSSPKDEVVVSVADQRMGLYSQGVLKKQYPISTSKFGLGDQLNSYRTPTGKHEIIAKIGKGLPTGAVLKSRSWNGEVLKPNAPGRDPIVSRILWLRGLESSNSNAMKRYIYIHGTTEENRLGQPASYGCIRMGMKDVVDVFDELGIGAKVIVTKDHLPGGKKDKPLKTEPVVDPAATPPAITPPGEGNAAQTMASLAEQSKKQNAQASATPEKAAALAAAASAPATSAPIPVTDEQIAKSSFFRPWGRGKSKAPEVEAPAPAPETTTSRPTARPMTPVAAAPATKGKAQPTFVATAPAHEVKEQAEKSSLFSFRPWSRGKSKEAEIAPPALQAPTLVAPALAPAPVQVRKKNVAPKKGSTQYLSNEHRIGPEKPKATIKDRNKTTQVERISSTSNKLTRRPGHSSHS